MTMRKTIFGCLGVAAVAFALQFTPADVQAQGFFSRSCDPCDAAGFCDPCDQIGNGSCFDDLACDPCGALNGCGPKAGKWFLNGHIEAGFFANGHGNRAVHDNIGEGRAYNGETGNTEYLQNTRLTGGQLNQVYISAGRSVDGRRGLDIGGTVDFTFGSDAYLVQARGLEYGAGHGLNGDDEGRWGTGDYFSAFAQAYIEAEYGRLNVKAGKFYAPFGIDSYKSTENFFYSWSPTMLIVPTTAGGAYATYKLNDRVSVLGGWVIPDELGESSKNNAVLGGFSWTPGKRFTGSYTFAIGKDTQGELFDIKTDYFLQSLTATAQVTKRVKYVFDWTLVNANGRGEEKSVKGAAYALMNELIYQHNKKWAFGTRFGVLNMNDYAAYNYDIEDGCDWYTVSLGANWTPNKWLTVKPEVRYDWTDAKDTAVKMFNGGNNTYQVSGGVSAVVKF